MDSLGASLSPPVHSKTQWTRSDIDNGQNLNREYTHTHTHPCTDNKTDTLPLLEADSEKIPYELVHD